MTPRDALARYWAREFAMAPPQIMSLVQLARHGSVDAWQPAHRADVLAQMGALSAFNDGSSAQHFARLSVPAAA